MVHKTDGRHEELVLTYIWPSQKKGGSEYTEGLIEMLPLLANGWTIIRNKEGGL